MGCKHCPIGVCPKCKETKKLCANSQYPDLIGRCSTCYQRGLQAIKTKDRKPDPVKMSGKTTPHPYDIQQTPPEKMERTVNRIVAKW